MESATEHQGRILLVDDESAILRTFRYCLEDEGYTVATANSAAQADALMQRQVFDLCFLDLRLGEDNGLDVLAQMRIQAPWMRVVIVTAHSAVDTAVDAIQAGAADYLVKPCSPDQLRLATAKQLEVRQLSARLEALEGEVRKPKDGLDSHSPAMKVVLETARQVAVTDANILILGESGTGKGELSRRFTAGASGRKILRHHQLSVADRRTDGKRAVRPQPWRVHRGQRKHLGACQSGRRRHAVS
jgi:NtrC-family two-component system response regulator AlgB